MADPRREMRGWDSSPSFSWLLQLNVALLLYAASAQAAETPIPHGTLELVAENQSVAPGHGFSLGLHFQLEKGWHISWINPGDSAEPPRVTCHLPPGLPPQALYRHAPRRLRP